MRTGFDGDGFMDDVTFDAGGGCQTHFQATHAAHDTAVDDNVIGNHFAFDGRCFADGQQVGANIAFHGAFDLDVAGRFQVAGDVQIRGKHGGRWFCLGRAGLEFALLWGSRCRV